MRSFLFHLAFELSDCDPSSSQANENKVAYLPPSDTDIFLSELPEHSTISWSQPIQDLSSTQTESLELSHHKDWRFDRISIISIDMDQSKSKTLKPTTKAKPLSADKTTKGVFLPADPKGTNVGYGVVHLYRDAKETPPSRAVGSSSKFDPDSCDTLCILAVPSYMTPSDLLGFVGEKTARENVSHFRLIRTDRTNKYMVLMKFRDAKLAKRWQEECNGKSFNSMEPESCHAVFVSSITFQTTEQSKQPSSFPNMTNDPFLPSSSSSKAAPTQLTKPLAPPTPALVELPTCPVCLERMDESTGLLIILCQHVFHCACLEKWKGSGCPVCRYTQSGGMTGAKGNEKCNACGSDQNLWICLICGVVGCGRYDNAHAYAHWEETNHSYAMDISTQHVWDYAGDGYVHRLIQNKGDGKLMHLPAAGKSGDDGLSGVGAEMVPREKMDGMANEYTYLLTSQLESQRRYYEEQLERAVDKRDKSTSAYENLSGKADILRTNLTDTENQLAQLNKEVERQRKRAEKSDGLARKFGSDWKEEKTINDSLMERVRFLEEKLGQLELEKKDLEEQNRDLGFFISGAEKLKGAGEDIVEGTVEVGPSASNKKKKGKGKNVIK
jgi:BRCA1-associated protein